MDLCFVDPPYNQGVSYGAGAKADLLPADDYAEWVRGWVSAAAGTLAPDGTLLLLISEKWVDVYMQAVRRAGLHIRRLVVWYESFGVNFKDNFGLCTRFIVYAVADPKRYAFNRGAVTRASARAAKYGDKRAAPGGKVWDSCWGIDPPIPRVCGTYRERVKGFPTQLPLKLLRACVGFASDPGDLVVDPFSGSGTTGVACREKGRRFAGCDLNPDYADRANARIAATIPLLTETPSPAEMGNTA